MLKYRIYCEECLNDYEIIPVNEPVEEVKPQVCPMCKTKIDDWFYDDEDEN